jgi:uncharacterized membrane protein YidH (DUF202 family)
MNSAFRISGKQQYLLIFGVPLLLIGVLIGIANSSYFELYSEKLSIGITVDLLLLVPVIYFLLIRKTRIPNITVVPFFIGGLVVCSLILPSENQEYLALFKTWTLPVVELCVLGYVIYNFRKAIKRFKLKKDTTFDFFTTLKATCHEIAPKIAVVPVATEIAVFYYGFIYWKKRKLEVNEFSYHKNSGTIGLLAAIIFIVAIETVTVHILLDKWSSIAAWIFTGLSVYSGIQIFGFLKSMFKRPIAIEGNTLYLRYGIMNEATIELNNIASIEISVKEIKLDTETRKLSFLGSLEPHNIMIKLKKEDTLTGLYGFRKTFKTLLLHIDKPNEFKLKIDSQLLTLNS